jgi:sugar phosphate isomerase/epimerase
MWAMQNFPNLAEFGTAAASLGFSSIELNHQVTSAMLAELDLTQIKISSIHEPCPADISTDELKTRDWLMSAVDETNRQQGVAMIKRSIDLAHLVGAPAVVVHAGLIPLETREKQLSLLYESGQAQSQEFLEIKNRLFETRPTLIGPRFEAVIKSLRELLHYASQFSVLLGLENRYHFMDIPNPDEMGVLLNLASSDQLGFVYDVGHAEAMDRLGFFSHQSWLDRYADRVIGVHIHDLIGVTDHYAPGCGEIDFSRVAAYLPDTAFRTCELRTSVTAEQVATGLEFLAQKGCIKEVK